MVDKGGLLGVRHLALENEKNDIQYNKAITENRTVASFYLVISNRKNHREYVLI